MKHESSLILKNRTLVVFQIWTYNDSEEKRCETGNVDPRGKNSTSHSNHFSLAET